MSERAWVNSCWFRVRMVILIIGFVCMSSVTLAENLINKGRDRYYNDCAACHGENGISPAPNWPNLAGQHKDYLVHSIKQYRSGEREDAVMAGLVVNLSDRDIADIAAYYAEQSGLYTIQYTGK